MDNLINRDWQVSNLDGVSLAELKQTVDQAKSTIDKLFAHQRLAGLSTKDQAQHLEKRQLEQQKKIYAQTSASTTTSNLNSKQQQQQQQQHFFSNGYQGKFTSGICSPGSNTQQDSSYSSIQAIKTIKQESKDNLSGGGLKDVREKLFQQRETKEDQFKQSQKYLQTKQQSQMQLQSSSESQIKQHQTSQQSSKDIIIEDNKAHIVINNQIKQQQSEDQQQCQEPSIDTRNGEGNEEIGQLMEMLKGLQKRVAGVEKKNNNNNNQQSKSNKQLQNNQDRRGSKKSNRKHGKNKRKEEKDYASSSESITSSCSSSSSGNSSSISGDSRGSKRNDTKDIENQENIKIFLRNMRIDRSMFREFKDAFGSETIFLRDVKQNRYKTLFFKLLGFTNHIANTTGISRNTNNNICSSISKTEGNEQLYPFSDALNLNANTIKNTLMSNNHALHIRQGSPLKQRQKRFELVDRRIKTSCNNYNNNSSYDYSFLNHSSNLIMPSQQQSPFNQQQQQHITGSPLSQQQLIKINEDFTSQMQIPLDKIDVTGRQFRKHNSNKSEQIDFRQQKHALQGPLSHRGAINQAEQYPMINANAVQVEQSYQQRLNIAIQQQQKEQLIQQQQKLQLQQQLQQQFSLQQFQLKQQEIKNISSSSPSSFVLQPPYQPQQQQQQQQQQFGFNGMNVQQKSEPLLLRQQLLAQHQKIQYPQQQQQFIQNQFQFPNNQGNNGNFPFFSVPQPNHWEYQRDGQYQQQEIQLPSSGLKPLVNQPQQLQYQQLYQTPKQSDDLVVPQNSEQQQQKRKDEFIMLDDSQGDDTIPLKNNIKHPQQQEHEQHNQRPTTPQEQHNRQRSNQGGSRASLINGLPTKKEKQSKSPQTLPLACEQCKDRKQSLRAYATSSSEIDYPQEKTRPSNSKPNYSNNNNILKVPSLNLNKMDGDNNLPNKISQFRASPLIGASPRNSRSQSCNNKARTPSNQFEKRVSPYEPGEEDALKKGFSNNPIYSVMPHLRVVYKKRQNEEALNKSREAAYYEGNQQKSQDETNKTPEQQISRNSLINFDQNENSVNHNTSNRNNNNKIKKQKYSINLVKSDSLEGGNNF